MKATENDLLPAELLFPTPPRNDQHLLIRVIERRADHACTQFLQKKLPSIQAAWDWMDTLQVLSVLERRRIRGRLRRLFKRWVLHNEPKYQLVFEIFEASRRKKV